MSIEEPVLGVKQESDNNKETYGTQYSSAKLIEIGYPLGYYKKIMMKQWNEKAPWILYDPWGRPMIFRCEPSIHVGKKWLG